MLGCRQRCSCRSGRYNAPVLEWLNATGSDVLAWGGKTSGGGTRPCNGGCDAGVGGGIWADCIGGGVMGIVVVWAMLCWHRLDDAALYCHRGPIGESNAKEVAAVKRAGCIHS